MMDYPNPQSESHTEPPQKRRFVAPLVATLIVVAILFGDHVVGWLYFKSLCKEAGAHIYRVVKDVPGLYWRTADRNTATEFGYRFIESGPSREVVTRYQVDGDVIEYKNVSPISRYAACAPPDEDMGLHIIKQEYIVTDEKADETIAKHISFSYLGGWVFRVVSAGFGGAAGWCPKEPFNSGRLVTDVLRPSARSNP